MWIRIESDLSVADLCDDSYLAVAYFADRSIGLALAAFNELGIPPEKINDLPLGLVLEVAALAQIRDWETSGMSERLREHIPSFRDAERQFLEQIANCPESFTRVENAELSKRVLQVSMRFVSWPVMGNANSTFTMGDFDEQAFVDALADFVWRYRYDLLPDQSEESDG